MNQIQLLRRWLPVAALALLANSAEAQTPAATLLPAQPNLGPLVVRGSTPDVGLPSFTGNAVPAVPAGQPKSWVGSKWTGLKDSVVGKPSPYEAKPTDISMQRNPLGATNPIFGSPAAVGVQPAVGPAPYPTQPNNLAGRTNSLGSTKPVFGSPMPDVLPTGQPLQNVYARPPAYRWYGYGGTTPGANPHSPSGVYPQGSANWYSQTGATPGAFPDTRIKNAFETSPVEAPIYAGTRPTNEMPWQVNINPKSAEAKPQPRFISGSSTTNPDPRVVARTPIGGEVPSMPSGTPMPIASSPEGPLLPSEPVAVPTADLNWQTAAGRGVPLPKEPGETIMPSLQPAAPETAWGPAALPKPTVSVIRGQVSDREPATLETTIRSACVGKVLRTDLRFDGDKRLVVTFIANSEIAAREAAGLVTQLSELKSYDVTFEAQIVGR